jgi:hypothetical protein
MKSILLGDLFIKNKRRSPVKGIFLFNKILRGEKIIMKKCFSGEATCKWCGKLIKYKDEDVVDSAGRQWIYLRDNEMTNAFVDCPGCGRSTPVITPFGKGMLIFVISGLALFSLSLIIGIAVLSL